MCEYLYRHFLHLANTVRKRIGLINNATYNRDSGK
jgi:hypothetical protein